MVGKTIRLLRHERGWSQEDAAVKLGISVPAFSKIETGVTDVNLSRLEQIAHVFEISLVQLLNYGDDPVNYDEGQLTQAQEKLNSRDAEIIRLQAQIISLFEELHAKVGA